MRRVTRIGVRGAIAIFFLFWLVLLLGSRSIEVGIVGDNSPAQSKKVVVFDTSNRKYPVTESRRVAPLEVEFEVLGERNPLSTGNEVYFTPPKTECGGIWRDIKLYTVLKGDWTIWGDWKERGLYRGGRWHATQPGSILRWKGEVSDSEVFLLSHPSSGKVKIRVNGADYKEMDLYGSEETWVKVALPTSEKLSTILIPLWPATYTVHGAGGGYVTSATTHLGSRGVNLQVEKLPNSMSRISITPWSLICLLSEILIDWGVILFRVIVVSLLCFLCGLPLSSTLLTECETRDRLSLGIFVGFATLVVLCSTFIYFTSLRYSLLLSGAILLLIAFVHRGRLSKLRMREIFASSDILLLGFLGATTSLVPALLYPDWFLGQNFTDSMDYIAWTTDILSSSFPAADTGAWRATDLVAFGVLSELSWLDPREALPFVGFFLCTLVPGLSRIFFVGLKPTTQTLCGIMVGMSAMLYALWSQDYLAQFIVEYVLLGTIVLCVITFERIKRIAGGWFYLPLSIGFGFLVSLYPYHAFPALIFGGATILLWARERDSRVLGRLLFVVIATCLAINVNFWVLLDLFSKSEHFDYLNQLASGLIIPKHSSVEQLYILFGLTDFGLSSELLARRPDLLMSRSLFGALLSALTSTYFVVKPLLFGLFWGMFGIGLVLMLRTGRRMLLLQLVCFWAMTFFLWKTGQYYPYAKFLFTTGLCMAIPIAFALGELKDRGEIRSSRKLFFSGGACFLLWISVQMLSSFYENSPSYLPRTTPLLARVRSHALVLGNDLFEFDVMIDTLKSLGVQSIGFYGEYQECDGTDKDRVLYNRMIHETRPIKFYYENGVSRSRWHTPDFSLSREALSTLRESLGALFVFRGYASPYGEWKKYRCIALGCVYVPSTSGR